MATPLISAVCVTGKSPFHIENLLPAAIACFHNQVYPNRELVLVTELPELPIPSELAHGTIRLISVPEAKSVGELRNAGLGAAKGEVIIQWDDDDWHHPDRMSVQFVALERTGVPSFLQRQLAYSFLHNTAMVREIPGNYMHGTVCHPRTDLRYPATRRGEDTEFAKGFPLATIIDNDPCLYVRLFHGRNDWSQEHVMREATWESNSWMRLSKEQRRFLDAVLAEHYPTLCSSEAPSPSPTPAQ